MNGTFKLCRTNEAIKRLLDGDIILNLTTEYYFKLENDIVFTSPDCVSWSEFSYPLYTFPPYHEWRSISNLHYYRDLKIENEGHAKLFLTLEEEVVDQNHPKADIEKKRWFVGDPHDWLLKEND